MMSWLCSLSYIQYSIVNVWVRMWGFVYPKLLLKLPLEVMKLAQYPSCVCTNLIINYCIYIVGSVEGGKVGEKAKFDILTNLNLADLHLYISHTHLFNYSHGSGRGDICSRKMPYS